MCERKIAIIGLGYVGLPLAVEFAKVRSVVGFDVNSRRVSQLHEFSDITNEVTSTDLESVNNNLILSDNPAILNDCDTYIVTVPTPIDEYNNPDLKALKMACHTIANFIGKGDIVVFESTVYPGVTEDVCVPILAEKSGLTYNHDFYCGYSPERINPGDKLNSIRTISKVVSGSTSETTKILSNLYSEVIAAEIHCASSIKVAESAKVIENIQRDVNIALMNELEKIFYEMGISFHEVLAAAGTKWNFLKFQPGLVGGHCIGVDPYYLLHEAKKYGVHPELISSARRINDNMSSFYGSIICNIIRKEISKGNLNNTETILIHGITFKENVPDLRNSKIFDLIKFIERAGFKIDVYDPYVSNSTIADLDFNPVDNNKIYKMIILAVPHRASVKSLSKSAAEHHTSDSIIFDLKGKLPQRQNVIKI